MGLKEFIMDEFQEPVSAHQHILSNNLLDQIHTRNFCFLSQ